MTTTSGPALRINYRFTLSSGELMLEVATLRRPEFVLRLTEARAVSVDERLLTRSFPLPFARTRNLALMVLDGTVVLEEIGRIGRGEAALVDAKALARIQYRSALHLYLEWAPGPTSEPFSPRRLGAPAMHRVEAVARALLSPDSAQGATLDDVFDLVRSIGAPCTLSVEGLESEPTDRDRSVARAIEAQCESLASRSSTPSSLGESMGLSERQVHRLFTEFARRYGVSARSWRDARNRWRLEGAVLLFSRADLTVADVAREVGYASPNALARAFAKAGFPPPNVVRQQLSENDPLP